MLLLAAVLAACGTADDEPRAGAPTTGAATTGAPTATEDGTMPDPTPRRVDPALSGQVDSAVADLADRLGVPADEITVVSAEAVTWGDTSLGCPQPGMRYAQVVTDGTKVVLEHDGTRYAYHSGGERRTPFLCEHPQGPVGKTTPTIDRTPGDS